MPRNHARQAFLELMRALFEEQKSAWSIEQPASGSEWACYQVIYQSGWILLNDFEEFDWTDNVGFAQRSRVMLLPPLDKDRLYPVMSLRYLPNDDFERSSLHIRVLLLKGREEKRLQGFGFRIESPHAYEHEEEQDDGEAGLHDFYHAQLISDMRYGATLDLPDWWPHSQPSFPLWAVNPVDAILNLLLTLYGAPYYRKFLISHGRGFSRGMSREFKDLNARLQARGNGRR